ncbi:MAG TPA: glycoside hydrolase family 28 protein [Verrucomicrobiae bacterium]|nr:glycoside hydrolase family 28 protein [Verrucomicrobiae bacterium]
MGISDIRWTTVLACCCFLTFSTEAATAPVFNVRDFGAAGDGSALDSPAINKAIEACAAAGGGTVWIPGGTYLSGSIRLTNNLNLHLDAGAILLAAPAKLNAYDPTESWEVQAYQDGGHTYFQNSLIWGIGLTNISITGRGMIDGKGLTRSSSLFDRMNHFNLWNKPDAVRTNLPAVRIGNKAIGLKLCRNVLLRDFTIYKGGHFGVLATGCDMLTIDNVTMDTERDGIDVDCCRNTTISNCRINSPFDDAICPKSSFALGTNVITENLTIVNCQVSGFEMGTLLDGTMKPSQHKNGRIKFGTEANGGFRNVTVANCTFRECRGLALEEVDGGIMENITINNLTMMDVAAYPIYITTGKRNRGPNVTGPSRARNILISGVIATGVEPMSGIQITGLSEAPIEGLRLENIRIVFKGGGTKEDAAREPKELGTGYPEPKNLGTMPAYGLFARHVRNLELANINLSFENEDLRPAMVCVDVDGLEIDNFKAQLAKSPQTQSRPVRLSTPKEVARSKAPLVEEIAAARFEQVNGFVVRNSPVLEGLAR